MCLLNFLVRMLILLLNHNSAAGHSIMGSSDSWMKITLFDLIATKKLTFDNFNVYCWPCKFTAHFSLPIPNQLGPVWRPKVPLHWWIKASQAINTLHNSCLRIFLRLRRSHYVPGQLRITLTGRHRQPTQMAWSSASRAPGRYHPTVCHFARKDAEGV